MIDLLCGFYEGLLDDVVLKDGPVFVAGEYEAEGAAGHVVGEGEVGHLREVAVLV